MLHHIDRAKHVYNDRGPTELLQAAIEYAPVECNNLIWQARHGSGTRVMTEDWDTLVILDACRYDLFANRASLDGRLESRISLGSTSQEFLQQNFDDEYHDTVYVTANAYVSRLGFDGDGTFHDVIALLDDSDDPLDIVHPETVTSAAIDAHERYPHKRVIVHYMQPHIPFIGEFGSEVMDEIDNRNVWVPFRNGNDPVSMKELWQAYAENLDIVLDYVEDLLDVVDGKTVLTADHGNMVGERQGPIPTRRMWGHPWGVYASELVKVPWFVVDGDRRTVRSDPPVEQQGQSEEIIERQLSALGYK